MRFISKYELEVLRAQSTSLADLAERANMTVPTLYRQMQMYGVPTSFRKVGANFKISEEEAYNLYVFEKKSLREIARMYDVSHQAVSKWLEAYGIAKRNSTDPKIKKKYPKTRKTKNQPTNENIDQV